MKTPDPKHVKSENPRFQPGGPPEMERRRRVLRTTYLMFAFAQLRAEMCENDVREARR